jgi:L-seryl-tRNA(Ser) seleniumtransferase
MAVFRDIPSIERLRRRETIRRLEEAHGHDAVVEALRAETADVRSRLAQGAGPDDPGAAIEAALPGRLAAASAPSLRRVINATGVILHTNLGRAPLSAPAAERAARLGAGYSNIEYDVAAGRRGRRDSHAEALLRTITGAAAAVVVNNNAAATLVVLAALAAGREVLISRGEMVEIGGGFRIPDVMAQSGARLREVGTTNRTRLPDYAASISERTGLILRVHPSNFRMEGFTERVPLPDLVALGRRFGVPVAEDLGSGYLGFAPDVPALRGEPDVRASIAAGVDIVMFSGDKLLGGPQAGIVAGTRDAVARVRQHPLMRALRVDKITYAALEATLAEYAAGRAASTIPAVAMILMTAEEAGRRADAIVERLKECEGIAAAVIDGESTIGGGSAPGSALPTRLVAIDPLRTPAQRLEAALRAQSPPVIARIEDGRVLLDPRTVAPEDDRLLAALVCEAASNQNQA